MDKLEIAQTKTIGHRLREARGESGLTMYLAAKQIGVTTSQLCNYEITFGSYQIPKWVIARAASVYSVSTDFLFGSTSDWERCADARRERDSLSFIQKRHFEMDCQRVSEQIRLQGRLDLISETVTKLPGSIHKIHDAMSRFIELNPEFLDMPGGSSLVRTIEAAASHAHQSNCKLVRHKFLPIEELYSKPGALCPVEKTTARKAKTAPT